PSAPINIGGVRCSYLSFNSPRPCTHQGKNLWALLGSNQRPPAPINIGGVRCSYPFIQFSQTMYAPGEEFVGPVGIEQATTCPDKYRGSQVLLSFHSILPDYVRARGRICGPCWDRTTDHLPR